jgi:putative addiction module killer protein
MPQVIRTADFDAWLLALRDARGRARIAARLLRLAAGNPGDVAPVGAGLSELRIDFGPGYRVYFGKRGEELVVILAGGDKASQGRDIEKAQAIWAQWKGENDGR